MAKVYTKTGDSGETGLIGGQRIPKNHIRVEAYGTIDEANALLGVILARLEDYTFQKQLEEIQGMLFEIGALLADPTARHARPDDGDVAQLEMLIDELMGKMEEQRSFILPGGTDLAATIHLARTVVRRAERRVITVTQHEDVPAVIVRYLNRLSDYLHTLARYINHKHSIPDKPWKSLTQ